MIAAAGGGVLLPGVVLKSGEVAELGVLNVPRLEVEVAAVVAAPDRADDRVGGEDAGVAVAEPGGRVGEVLAGGIAGVFWYYGRNIEHVDVAAIRDYRPPQVTRIVARDGTVLGEIFTQRRTLIRFEDIPKHVVDAFLAAEDADFYHHEGMDYFGMARAALTNLEAGELRQGASTITQQVVKNMLVGDERSVDRKVREAVLAMRIEKKLNKVPGVVATVNYATETAHVEAPAAPTDVSTREVAAVPEHVAASLLSDSEAPPKLEPSPETSPKTSTETRAEGPPDPCRTLARPWARATKKLAPAGRSSLRIDIPAASWKMPNR